jgi:hypothetical protein
MRMSQWFDRLSPELKNQVLEHALEIFATRTKYLELEQNGGENAAYYRLMQASARSGAPGAEELWVKWASQADGADPEEKLRADFDRCLQTSVRPDGVTVGTLLHMAQKSGANFDRWKRQAPYTPALPPGQRKTLRGGTYSPDEALGLLNSHYLIGKSDQEVGIFRIKDDGSLAFIPPEQFKLDVANIFVRQSRGASKPIPVEKFWKESPQRHQRRIVFKPGGTTEPDEFNLWRGFAIEPRKGWQKQQTLLRHIGEIICRRDQPKFWYLLRWLAWTVQNPDKQAGVVIVLKSPKQGTGKTTLGVVMLSIFGQHGALIDDKERLLGRFNDWLETTPFVLGEEVLWAGDHKTADKLKSLITADTIRAERKFGNCRSIPNRLHVIMTTNHEHGVAAGVGDRRYVVLEVDDKRAGNKAWFDRLYRDLNTGGTNEFLYLLQNLQLGDWHPRAILKTAEATEQQRMSSDSVSQWAKACIDADAIIGEARYSGVYDLGARISVESLREAYTGYCKQYSLRPVGPDVFGKACADMFGPRIRMPPSSMGASTSRKARRPWGYEVPDGDSWQEKLDARLGIRN